MPILTVSQINNYIKRYIAINTNLSDVWISGEISNFKIHYSGHAYFSLKDENAVIQAVIFKQFIKKIKFDLKNGMKIIALGKISVFERDGSYRLYIENAVPDGVGELNIAYEQLKSKLQNAGLFSSEFKKNLPIFPKKIGIVTSLSGAAIKDIIAVSKTRFPLTSLCIYPAKVQGEGAGKSICEGIVYLDKMTDSDVIIISRGGGSIEDLWAFNEENTAYSIFNCTKPVISAVGHETDYTISDFVADKRAATPSAAIEVSLPDCNEIKIQLYSLQKRLFQLAEKNLFKFHTMLHSSGSNLIYSLENEIHLKLYSKLFNNYNMLNNHIENLFKEYINNISEHVSSLEMINPIKVMKRGYSVITDENNEYVDADMIKINDILNIKHKNGSFECIVRRIKNDRQ